MVFFIICSAFNIKDTNKTEIKISYFRIKETKRNNFSYLSANFRYYIYNYEILVL